MKQQQKKFSTQVINVAYIYDLYQRKRIIFTDKINRKEWRKWNKEQRNSFIEYLKKDYPVKPLICYRRIVNDSLSYYICDGYNRIRAIMKYLKKRGTSEVELMMKLIVLEIIPEELPEKEVNDIYEKLNG